ncbi:MAG: hypothetical protein AAF600_10475, partial [Bacteroidota bacterium]
FGVHHFGPKADAPRSMALGSMLYDVLNQLTIDARLAPYSGSERALLLEHLAHVYDHDLLLLDRGYPCFWLLFLLQAKGIPVADGQSLKAAPVSRLPRAYLHNWPSATSRPPQS